MILIKHLGVPLMDRVRPQFHKFQKPAASVLTKTRTPRLQLNVMQVLTAAHIIERFVQWQLKY